MSQNGSTKLTHFIHSLFEKKRQGFSIYLITLLIIGVAFLLRLSLFPLGGGLTYITFFPAVTLCAIFGGYRAGLFATLLGIALATYVFTPPFYSFSLDVFQRSLGGNLFFLFDGAVVSASIEAMHRYKEKSDQPLKLPEKISIKVPIKIFLITLLPFLITISLSAYVICQIEKNHIESDFKNRDHEAVNAAILILKNHLKSAAFEINVLKNATILIKTIDSPTSENLNILQNRFVNFAENSHNLLQVRWIDNSGKEKVRVDMQNNKGIIISDEKLLDKSDRYYFKETQNLSDNEIYISPLDLNIENGKVIIPYQPTFRIAVALFNSKHQRQGILILNFCGENFLSDVISSVGNRADKFLLLNSQGYFLHSSDESEKWGFALNKPMNTFAYTDPEMWQDIHASSNNRIRFRGDVWTWESVYPHAEINKHLADFNSPVENKERWICIIYTDREEIQKELDEFMGELILPVLFMTMLSLWISIWIAKSRYQIEKLTHSLIERTQSAEAASLAKANFLSNMSHEIRTPMNAILGLTFILEKSNLSQDDKALLGKIHTAGKSLLGIINNVLDISKIEAGKFDLEISVFNLHDILDNLATIMTFNASEKNIDLIIHPPIGVHVNRLKGDSLRLQQVLVNLIGNAIKFTHQGHIDVTITVLECNENSVYLHFSVSDTGDGIPKDVQETIFTSFSQADNSITRRYGGTGLGLTISRQLVELMGGEITLTSEEAKGSDFSFNLRFDYIDANDTIYPDNKSIDILIADDNEIVRNALLSITKILGWSAVAVDSGEAALHYVSTHKNHDIKQEVILLDWQMPNMDGLITAKAIHEKMANAKKKPIVIMVTAYEKRFLDEYPDADIFDAVLSKPVTASSLYDAISKAMRGNKQLELQKQISTPVRGKRLEGRRLLVVDDNEINLEVASLIFEAEGAVVAKMDNGYNAVEWLKSNPKAIDIILMDIQMPIMNGYEATRLIREIPELTNLPVVALSAGVFKSQIELAKSVGIDDFIAKPFDINAAVNLIAKLTGHINLDTICIDEIPSNSNSVDLEAALKIWGDIEIYKRYLLKFSTECELLLNAITNENAEEFARLIHKTKGAAKMLGLIEIDSITHEMDELLKENQDITQAIERLKYAISTTQNFIQEYATSEQTLELETELFDDVKVTALLKVVLHRIEQDSPDGLTITIDELSRYVTKKRIEPLKQALDAFDFPLAKSEVMKLAAEYNLSLGTGHDSI
ncbi:MAG: response regulator [Methylococcaceae bacterium]